jgi:hypothetical protein
VDVSTTKRGPRSRATSRGNYWALRIYSLMMPNRCAILANDSRTSASCSTHRRSNVRHRIRFGLLLRRSGCRAPTSVAPKSVRAPYTVCTCILARTGVSKPMAATPGEDAAAVEDRYPPSSVERRQMNQRREPPKLHSVRSMRTDHAVIFDPHLNPRHYFAVAPPLPAAPVAEPQYSFARPAPHVQGCVNLPSSTSRRTASGSRYPAHPSDFPVINW